MKLRQSPILVLVVLGAISVLGIVAYLPAPAWNTTSVTVLVFIDQQADGTLKAVGISDLSQISHLIAEVHHTQGSLLEQNSSRIWSPVKEYDSFRTLITRRVSYPSTTVELLEQDDLWPLVRDHLTKLVPTGTTESGIQANGESQRRVWVPGVIRNVSMITRLMFWTLVIAGAIAAIAHRFPALLRARRIAAGLCPTCAYPVGTSPVCTECGKPVTPKSVEPA